MGPHSSFQTPASLLQRLRDPDDPDAWNRFVDLYTPILYRWARRIGMQDADVSDLVQNVVLHLLKQLPHFCYESDRRFRGWLWTVLRNKYRESLRRRKPDLLEDPDRLAIDDVEELGEEEYRQALAQRSLELMQRDFQPATWKSFWEHLVSGKSAEQVGAELGLSPGAVRAAKFRVLCRLRAELRDLFD